MLAIIFAGNILASNVHAEIKNYAGRGAALLDFTDEKPEYVETAKNVAKLRAIKKAFERAGFFILSFTSETLNGKTTDEYISAIVRDMATIEGEEIKKYYYNSEEYNRPGYIYEANLIAKIDTDKIAKYLHLDVTEKQKLIERDKSAKKNFEEIDSDFENLRKTADKKTPAQIKTELEKIDSKISEQNKPVEQKNLPMIFSQIVKIGSIGYPPDGDITIENATYISSKPKAKFQNEITYPLDTDVKFNSGEDSIYAHSKSGYNVPTNFGDENIKNTIAIETGLYGISVYQLKSNSSIKFYLLQTQEASADFVNWICIGKKDGKWIKYFDLKDIRKKYFGEKNWHNYTFALYLEKLSSGNYTYPIIYCKNNTIFMEYQKYESSTNGYTKGEFRFKWDDAAQWFGIEKVTY